MPDLKKISKCNFCVAAVGPRGHAVCDGKYRNVWPWAQCTPCRWKFPWGIPVLAAGWSRASRLHRLRLKPGSRGGASLYFAQATRAGAALAWTEKIWCSRATPFAGTKKNVATFRGQTFASKDRRDGFRAAAAVRSFSSTTKGMRMIRRVERRHGGAPWVPVRV